MKRLTDKEVLHAYADTICSLHRLEEIQLDVLLDEIQTLKEIHQLMRSYQSAELAIAEL